MRKHKYPNADITRAAAVVEAVDHAKREVLAMVLLLQISFHQRQEKHLSRLSAVMVVQLGLSCLQDGVLLLSRVSLRGSHSSSHSQ